MKGSKGLLLQSMESTNGRPTELLVVPIQRAADSIELSGTDAEKEEMVVESLQATASRPVQCSISQPDNGATIVFLLQAITTLQSNNTSTASTTRLATAVGTMESNGGIQLQHTTASMLVVVSTEVGQQSATTTREVLVEVVPVMCECANKVKTAAACCQAWTNESLLVAEEEEDPVRVMILTAAVAMRDGADTVVPMVVKTDTAMAGLVMVELNLLEVKGNGKRPKRWQQPRCPRTRRHRRTR